MPGCSSRYRVGHATLQNSKGERISAQGSRRTIVIAAGKNKKWTKAPKGTKYQPTKGRLRNKLASVNDATMLRSKYSDRVS